MSRDTSPEHISTILPRVLANIKENQKKEVQLELDLKKEQASCG